MDAGLHPAVLRLPSSQVSLKHAAPTGTHLQVLHRNRVKSTTTSRYKQELTKSLPATTHLEQMPIQPQSKLRPSKRELCPLTRWATLCKHCTPVCSCTPPACLPA